MSVDLDRLMRQYRECARHVWNTYFQPLQDGWHEFIGVEQALLSGLVLEQAGIDSTRKSLEYIQGLRVRPVIPPMGYLDVFLAPARVPEDRVTRWRQGVLKPGEVDLRFLCFFDWAGMNDPQDYRYVRARVLATGQPELEGCDVLLEFQAVSFERV
ncbi:hypothetical protein JYK02_02010 [Corallococcus macrosporus]|uniref:Uncharacterized protein n=1 Tax=Corallococcus macrosporus TaxID=35 RepID=A0ABS3D3T2_9BACT|nr:hypothetical protein [Corallococcus macrosporus]MBN8226279.1 hypothetical protein [Corallococcus macrosporus]